MALPVPNGGADVTVAQGALPVAAQTFDGSASIPGTGAAAITGYSWTLMDKPVGSAASLLNATAQVVTLQNAETWGNYRLMLVVTDDLGAKSLGDGNTTTDNPLLAVDGAFVHLRVTATNTGLQKPAKGERNTHVLERAETQVVDDLKGQVDDIAVPDLTDVASPLTDGPALDRLCDGTGYATDDGLATGVPMHLHPAGSVGPATTTVLGGVLLAEAPGDPANPVAVAHDDMWLTATIVGSLDTGVKPRWKLPYPVTIIAASVYLANGGTIVGGTYVLDVVGNGGTATLTVPVPGIDTGPTFKLVTGLSISASADVYFQFNGGSAGADARDVTYLVACRRL